MKTINGKKYYISIGYIDDKVVEEKQRIEAKDIKSIFFNPTKKQKLKKEGVNIFYDDSDKDSIVALPLVEVNEIQCKNGKYFFRTTVDPINVKHIGDDNLTNKYNIVGLFGEFERDGEKFVRFIKFFDAGENNALSEVKIISVELNKKEILGE